MLFLFYSNFDTLTVPFTIFLLKSAKSLDSIQIVKPIAIDVVSFGLIAVPSEVTADAT